MEMLSPRVEVVHRWLIFAAGVVCGAVGLFAYLLACRVYIDSL
jgi:hypothetical protein